MTQVSSWKRASHRLLKTLVHWAYWRSATVVACATVLFFLCIAYTAHSLVFIADRSSLINSGERFARLSRAYEKEFPNSDEMVVVVEGSSTAQREAFVDALAEKLRPRKDLFKDTFQKVELPFLKTHALGYLDFADLEKLVSSLEEAKGMVSALTTETGIGNLLAESSHDLEKMLPMLNEILAQFLKALETRGRYQYISPWEKAFFEDAGKNQREQSDALKDAGQTTFYNTMARGEIHLFLVRPTGNTEKSVTALRQEVLHLRAYFPGISAGITGEGVLDQDEMDSSISDSAQATLWSLALVSLGFILSFRYLSRPLMALYALTLSMGWTLGFTTLAIGHLNLLTVTFATMLIGLGADFGIHFIFGYEEERFRRLAPYEAMQKTMEGAGAESFTGAVTTAIAFYAIRFTDFKGVAELGMIAGTGVVFAFLAMATVLPALIFMQERRQERLPHQGRPRRPRPYWAYPLAVLERYYLSHPKWVILVCGGVTVAALSGIPQVKFDYNLLHLQSPKLASVQTETKMLNASSADSHGLLFAVSLADSLETAAQRSAGFSKLPSVSKVESVLPLIPTDYARKIPLLKKIQAIMADIPLPNADGPAGAGTGSGLRKMGDGFMVLQESFDKAYPQLLKSPDEQVRTQAKRFKNLLNRLFRTLEKMGPGPISDGVTAFQKNLFSDLRGMLEFLQAQRAEPPITLADLPDVVRLRSIGTTGKILLRIYPKENPWERAPLTQFVSDLQSVDPDVIGTPIMVYYYTEALKRAYEISGWNALAAITIVLLLHFRNLRNTLLALLPKIVGVIWMVGTMAYFKVDFNPANFMALPLILGIGLIFGVHVVHRLLHDPHDGIFSHATGPAIALSAATTMSGFGTLMLAKHQGIASLGFLMTTGVGASLITSLVLLPAVMRVLTGSPPLLRRRRRMPLAPNLSKTGIPAS